MIGSNLFSYINVLDKVADAGWLRSNVIGNNVANADTPNYKRKDVQFETFLSAELQGGEALNQRVGGVDMTALNPLMYTDSSSTSYRIDGNNVDPDTEQVTYAKTQYKYSNVVDALTSEFNRIKIVLQRT